MYEFEMMKIHFCVRAFSKLSIHSLQIWVNLNRSHFEYCLLSLGNVFTVRPPYFCIFHSYEFCIFNDTYLLLYHGNIAVILVYNIENLHKNILKGEIPLERNL